MWNNFWKTLQNQLAKTIFVQASNNTVFIKNTQIGRVRCDRTECRRNILNKRKQIRVISQVTWCVSSHIHSISISFHRLYLYLDYSSIRLLYSFSFRYQFKYHLLEEVILPWLSDLKPASRHTWLLHFVLISPEQYQYLISSRSFYSPPLYLLIKTWVKSTNLIFLFSLMNPHDPWEYLTETGYLTKICGVNKQINERMLSQEITYPAV